MIKFVSGLLGLDARDRYMRRLTETAARISALEPGMKKLSDDQLAALTQQFRDRIKKKEPLDKLLHEAFAAVREAASRTLGMRHFDVQLMGGIVLHEGKIAEMRTGEGKTLVATLPAYLNALEGRGVHVITANDYLATRDAAQMSRVFGLLNMSVGCIQHGIQDWQRQQSYACDITYGTNNEMAFDYLRDNMKFQREHMVHRGFRYAVVDEVDSLLIDEARTPLIISGEADDAADLCRFADEAVRDLQEGVHYEIDHKSRSVTLTDHGADAVEASLRTASALTRGGLYDAENGIVASHAIQSLRAHAMFKRDKEYLVHDGKVVIVDEFTGRSMPGRRYSDGLHQAIEAKEGVEVLRENVTLASVTFQNFFRMYDKLSGMTGTAMTEQEEFGDIYKLAVIPVPTNLPVQRIDHDDDIYLKAADRDAAVLDLIADCHSRKQPVLVGTSSIAKSEALSGALSARGIPHSVLNARQHEHEAKIIAQAGRPGAVTIATNMAGRGTDIKLGGDLDKLIEQALWGLTDETERPGIVAPILQRHEFEREEAAKSGGLFVIGVERNESRRIDDQLRGRAGRQGEPGSSKFFLSLQDDLMKALGSGKLAQVLPRLGLKEGEALAHPFVTKAVSKAQHMVEVANFDMRKNLLKYDDVINGQREAIYAQRMAVIDETDHSDVITEMRKSAVEDISSAFIPDKAFCEQWNWEGITQEAEEVLGVSIPAEDWTEEEISKQQFEERLLAAADSVAAHKEQMAHPAVFRALERHILLTAIDMSWQVHISDLDHLRQTISLRAYGQRNPLHEFHAEAFSMFEHLLSSIRRKVTRAISTCEVLAPQDSEVKEAV